MLKYAGQYCKSDILYTSIQQCIFVKITQSFFVANFQLFFKCIWNGTLGLNNEEKADVKSFNAV